MVHQGKIHSRGYPSRAHERLEGLCGVQEQRAHKIAARMNDRSIEVLYNKFNQMINIFKNKLWFN